MRWASLEARRVLTTLQQSPRLKKLCIAYDDAIDPDKQYADGYRELIPTYLPKVEVVDW